MNWGTRQGEGLYGPYSFPIAFPNACEVFMPVTLTPEAPGHNASRRRRRDGQRELLTNHLAVLGLEQVPAPDSTEASQGFYWFAVGF